MLQLDLEAFQTLRKAGGAQKFPTLVKPSLPHGALREAVDTWVKYHPQQQHRQLARGAGHGRVVITAPL